MHIVVRGRIVPKHHAPGKPFGQQFNARMSEHVVGDLKNGKRKKRINVHGQAKNQDGTNQPLNEGFVWMKRIGSPGRWVGGKVVCQMDMLK